MATFILSDESLNSYGFRVLTNGIDIKSFEKNPIMLSMHDRSILPIGKWENLRVEDKKLLGDAVFDDNDELARKIKSKVEQGILNATSIGIDIVELSEDRDLLEKGQYRPTVTKSRLFEVSIVDIPSNANALKLNFPTKGIQLSGGFDEKSLELSLPRIQGIQNSFFICIFG